MIQIITRNAEATIALGEALAAVVVPNDVVLLSGELGAGKTVLAKGIARGLGVSEEVTSPTFNILLTQECPGSRCPRPISPGEGRRARGHRLPGHS